jgi:3-hydroxypropanoate dehydrogenase
MDTLQRDCLEQIFYGARTHNKWHDKPVTDEKLQEIYDLMRLGPTSANCSPLRLLFLKSKESKERLKPYLAPGNLDKTMLAPVTALIAYDLDFYEKLPYLFPYADAKTWFEGNAAFATETAFRNGTLQGAYFIIAARSCGLDCGPMSGFANEGLDQEFFPEGRLKSNFLCNIGYGDPTGLPGPRAPRLSFDEACKIL